MLFMPIASLADRIDALLPQTQCTKCGYDGCRPYAHAIATGVAAINRCPPGAEAGVAALAALLDVPVLPLDRSRGQPGPLTVAVIDEAHCIGCTLCISACPVDAIVGANKRMHTVLDDHCTGCELCVAPCPVDCISMAPAGREWNAADAALGRRRHDERQARLQGALRSQEARLATGALPVDGAATMDAARQDTAGTPDAPPAEAVPAADDSRKRAAIESALARARARRAASSH